MKSHMKAKIYQEEEQIVNCTGNNHEQCLSYLIFFCVVLMLNLLP